MTNMIKISGVVDSEPELEETYGSEKIYSFNLKVKKPAKQDFYIIRVRISSRFRVFKDIKVGTFLMVAGSLRSCTSVSEKKVNNKRHRSCMVVVFCSAVEVLDSFKESINEGEVQGVVSSVPRFFEMSSKMPQRTDLRLSIARGHGKVTILPTTFRGRQADYASEFKLHDKVYCTGRIQSRVYHKRVDDAIELVETTEFVVSTVEKITDEQ